MENLDERERRVTERERIHMRLLELERQEQRTGRTLTEAEMLRLNLALRDLGRVIFVAWEPVLRRLRLTK